MADVVQQVDEDLRNEMVEAQAQITRFVTEQKACADSVALRVQRMLEVDKENHTQLRKDQDAVAAAEETLQQNARELSSEIERVGADLEKLTGQESKLPVEQQRLTQQLSTSRALVAQREAGFEQAVAAKEHKLTELDKGIALYKTRLGLEFERVGEDSSLRLIFTNIDPADPMRQFSFHVFVDGGDKYHVQSCEPLVQGLDSLVDALNAKNDFGAFVHSMRKGFKAGL